MMENQVNNFSPESLARIIRAQFPEIIDISDDSFWMTIFISEDILDPAPFIKALHEYLKDFIDLHGNPKEEYQFSIQRGRELIDILHFNNPDAFYTIAIELFGKMQTLRVQDVLGFTSDFTLFNGEFEKIGTLSAVGLEPEKNPDGTLANPEEMDDYSDHIYPDFTNEEIWKIEPETLQPYINEIRLKVLEQIHSNHDPMEVDVEDAEDMAFWAEQFELSVEDLRKAILVAGKSIDDITAYLQK